VECYRLIPIAEYIAFDKAFLESELAALAWILESRSAIEGTGEPYPIPAELAEAARRCAVEAEREGVES
jgi:hypothetical protein